MVLWHYGEIGQTHLPDLPRGDALEFDPFWNTRYKEKVTLSKELLNKMNRALRIISDNQDAGVSHDYDFEIFRTTAELVSVYEQTRLPKGYSTEEKAFFWQQDRARHFAFRRPDMTFLINDEQLLDMEGYLERLKDYIEHFKTAGMN